MPLKKGSNSFLSSIQILIKVRFIDLLESENVKIHLIDNSDYLIIIILF